MACGPRLVSVRVCGLKAGRNVGPTAPAALLVGLLWLGLSAGWAGEPKRAHAAHAGDGRAQLERLLEQLKERRTLVETVAVRLNFTLYDNQKNKEHALVGAYLGDKDGNMRLRITAVTNHLVLDMGRHGDKVEVHLPRKDRFFAGKLDDLLNNQSQLTLLAHVGNAHDLFFPCAWTANAVGRMIAGNNGRAIVNVIEKPSVIRRRSRRLTMSPNLPMVEDLEAYDRYGREVGLVRYFDYQFPAGVAATSAGGLQDAANLPYPGRIALCPHGSAYSLVMQVEEFILNAEITPSKFDVERPEEVKVLDLGHALKKSGSLWD